MKKISTFQHNKTIQSTETECYITSKMCFDKVLVKCCAHMCNEITVSCLHLFFLAEMFLFVFLLNLLVAVLH